MATPDGAAIERLAIPDLKSANDQRHSLVVSTAAPSSSGLRRPDETHRGDEKAIDDLALVALVHEGVFEQRPWSRFLRAFRMRAAADYANIIFRRNGSPDDGLIEWVDAEGDPTLIKDHYYRSFAGRDPFPYFRMEPGRVHRLPDLMESADYEDDPYFREFLKPHGLEHLLLFRVLVPDGHQAWVTLTRPRNGKNFPEETARLCALIAPHFTTALRSYGELEAARLTRQVRDRVMQKLHFGHVTINARRIVIWGDDRLSGGSNNPMPLHLDAAGKVRLSDAVADRELGVTLSQITDGAQTAPKVIIAKGKERLEFLVVPLTSNIAGASAAVASIYFQLADNDPEQGRTFHRALRDLFQLSEAEATLAMKLVEGCTLGEAAAAIPLTIESARTYLKRVFAKTGTARQADMVRLLLRSVAVLA